MKILMPILHYFPVIGGLETWTQNIAERLSDKAKIFIVTAKVKNQPLREVKNRVKIVRTSLFSLSNLSYSSSLYILTSLPFIFFNSLSLIKKEKINLLHCQGFLSSLLGYFLFKITKIPYLVTVQRLEKGKLLKKIVYRNAALCIGASFAIKDYFKKIGVKNIEVIPNGIDLGRFKNLNRQASREKLGLNDEFIIMTVARLERVKGIEYLIKAVKDFKLLIIGDGSERKNLENLVGRLNLKDKVKFLGSIPNKKIPDYLVAADCFVLPSLKEGFGISLLEAQAAEVPVVGTKVGGILDIIEDQKTGLLVKSQNPEAISRAITKIHSDSGFAQNLVKNAKVNLAKYDWQNIAEKVYEDYLSHRHIST